MKRDEHLPDSSATCTPRKPSWGPDTLLAAGFLVGCLIGRTRLGKGSMLFVAGGLAWELLRSKPRVQVHYDTTQRSSPDPRLLQLASEAPTVALPAKHAATTPLQPLATAFAELRPIAFETPLQALTQPTALSDRDAEAFKPAPVPEQRPSPVEAPEPIHSLLASPSRLQSAPTAAPAIFASSAFLRSVEETHPRITPQPEPAPVVVTLPPASSEAEVISQPVTLPIPEPVVTFVTTESPPIAAPESEPVQMPMMDGAEAVMVPLHLDPSASAAWLLGLEPIPMVHEEPAWRRPLLAGIQSAFENISPPAPPSVPMIAAGSAIPDAIEITSIPSDEAERPTPPLASVPTEPVPSSAKPSTRGLLGKLFESPLKPKTTPLAAPVTDQPVIEPPVIEPAIASEVASEVEPTPAPLPAAAPASPSWLADELQGNKRRFQPLIPVTTNAAANAAAVASTSPIRRVPAIAGNGQTKKSWLGLWK